MPEPRKILVRGPNWTGDVVMATPGFRALRSRFPEAHITLHLRPGLEPLVHGAPWFDAVRPVVSYHGGPLALLREAAGLRREGFDLGVCLPDSFSSALLLRVAGVGTLVGYRRGGRGPLLHRALDPPRDAQGGRLVPRERHVLGVMGALGCATDDTRPELFTTADEVRHVDGLLADAGVAADAPLAVLAPGASYGPSKLWPAERFAAVGDDLAAAGAAVAVTGTPDEVALVERVAGAMRAPAARLHRGLGLGGLKALLARARVLVCNDAGARHVAVAFGVPAVVFFGPTAIEKTGLNLERVTVLHEPVECSPCYQRDCPIDHRCMMRIPVERAAAAARAALAASAPAATAGGRA